MPKIIKPVGKSSHRGAAPLIRKMAIKYPELSQSEIARTVGCDESNVRGVLREFLRDTSIDKLRDFQNNKADVFDVVQLQLLESITPDKLTKASALQAMTAAAIAEDKARLIRGQATSINVNVLMDVVEAMRSNASSIATAVDHGTAEASVTPIE